MRTFSGEKLSAIGEVGRIQIRDTSIPSFYPVFSMAKPVRRMSVRPKIVLRRLKNRLPQNGKSYGAECTGGFCILLGNSFSRWIIWMEGV